MIKTSNGLDFLCSYVVTSSVSISAIKQELSKNLPYYMIPSHILLIDKMPINLNGKIDKKSLPPIILDTVSDIVNPTTNTEKTLVNICKTLLELDDISVTSSLFEMGADSLVAIRLSVEVFHDFHIQIGMKDIFANSTIRELASYIDGQNASLDTGKIAKAEKMEYYPVSSAEKRIYLASNLEESTVYNIAGGIIFDTLPDLNKLNMAFNELIKRHEILRTYFELVDGQIVQKIEKRIDFSLPYEKSNSDNIDQIFGQFNTCFAFNNAPLFKAKLVNMNDKKFALLLNMHHIIADGSSLNILLKELSFIYNGKKLDPLPIQYKDFSVWEQNQMDQKIYKQSEEFWLSQFSEEIPVLNMPTTYSRPSSQSFEGTHIRKDLGASLQKDLKKLAKQLRVTPFMLFLSCYYILLYKYSMQNEIIVGTPTVGRQLPELSNLIGMFVNTVALKTTLNPKATFIDYVQEVKQHCLSCFEHDSYPFDTLVKQLDLKRDPSRSPLFDTMFIYQNEETNSLSFDNINSSIYTPSGNTSKYDFSLEILPQKENCTLNLEYCTDLFSATYMEDFLLHYENILKQIINDPTKIISQIDMLSLKEKEKIQNTFNNNLLSYDKEKTIVDMFEDQVRKSPNSVAIKYESSKITYSDLNNLANQLAHMLLEKGLKKNDVVGVLLPRSFNIPMAMLGILKAGGAYLLIDSSLPQERIDYMLKKADVNFVITDSLQAKTNVNHIILLEKQTLNSYSKDNLSLSFDNNTNLAVVFTSGSTGKPKGVLLRRLGMINLVNAYKKDLNIESFNTFLSICSIAFDMFAVEVFLPLLTGKLLVMANEEEQKIPASLSDLIVRNKADFILITPSKIKLLLLDNETAKCLSVLKSIQLGGEALTSSLYKELRALTNASICNEYGPTETTACCCFKEITSKDTISIGKPLANIQMYICDNNLSLCPAGVPGEICIAGLGVSYGYINDEEKTNKVFVRNPFGPGLLYKSGDIAKYDNEGNIEYIGRKDFQIKIRGLRIELSEIEKQISLFEGINDCCVIYKNEENNPFLAAFFTADSHLEIKDLRENLGKVLPLYMIPKYFIQLSAIPMTRTGKINRQLLEQYDISSEKTNTNFTKPETELQALLCNLWEELLNCKVGIDDDLFELGADSLLAIKFKVSLLSNGIDIPYSHIFKYKTIREICKKKEKEDSNKTYIAKDFDNINQVLLENKINKISVSSHKSDNVLLLGANGFVGIHILYSLLKNGTGKVYCIVRNKNGISARTRFLDILHFYFGTSLDNYLDKRFFIVEGSITNHNFGLTASSLDILRKETSIVINAAANVKHFGSYDKFQSINIDATKEIINFCKAFNKRFIHLSTLSVSGNSLLISSEENNDIHSNFSEQNLYIGQKIDNVYIKSKFEAEKVILNEIATNHLDAQILRLGNITSRANDGVFQINPEENAFLLRLRSFIRIGYIPDSLMDLYAEFTPVDVCADAICSIVFNNNAQHSVYHIYNPYPIYIKDLVSYLSYSDISLQPVSQELFAEKITNLLASHSSDNLLSGIINDLTVDKRLIYTSSIKIESDFSTKFLEENGFAWPKLDKLYIKKLISYLQKIKFL